MEMSVEDAMYESDQLEVLVERLRAFTSRSATSQTLIAMWLGMIAARQEELVKIINGEQP